MILVGVVAEETSGVNGDAHSHIPGFWCNHRVNEAINGPFYVELLPHNDGKI